MRYDLVMIEGEYYSGANEVGKYLSEKLGVPCFISDVIQTAAARGHTSSQDLERLKETTVSRLLHDIYTAITAKHIPNYDRQTLSIETEVMRRLAEKEPCIIVESGFTKRALPELKVVSIFIYTSLNARINHAVQRQVDVSLRQTMCATKRHDRLMAKRHEMYSDYRWVDRVGYDMVLDSEELGFNGCAEAIASIVK